MADARPSTRKAPTVYDVAATAGVSIATVSRVLRRPDDVRPDTATRVLAAVRELGYVPSASARNLAGRRTGVVGLLLPGHDAVEEPPLDAELLARRIEVHDDRLSAEESRPGPVNLYHDEVVRGAEGEAWRTGFALLVAAGRSSSREVLVDDIAGRVDGLVILASTIPDDLLQRVSERVPIVMVADSSAGVGLDRVTVANADGMHALVERVLADHPVRRLAYVSGPEDSPDESDRRAGLERAVANAPRPVELVQLKGDFSERRGREVAAALLDQAGPDAASAASALPEALICANDQTALGVLDVFARAGIPVPGRVVVTGFDGVDAGRFSVPRLTTVRQPMADLGRVAVATLVRRLENPDAPPSSLTLPVEVLLRESCPPATI